ncbi:hypothetical protein PVK06_010963 [Gossypium arboreum]|uniref:Uncharacterized protein n=1 Tax=Gossypium arboreum TaxID=29729 RepID=A0ABR0Q7R6_GOSAR|nr:hypothetical protein PVK06_010963 [Gossypium arboreum]
MLRVYENEFLVLPDLSTLEVPPTNFELVPDKGLCRNPKGYPQSSRIHNKMHIKEKSDGVDVHVVGDRGDQHPL